MLSWAYSPPTAYISCCKRLAEMSGMQLTMHDLSIRSSVPVGLLYKSHRSKSNNAGEIKVININAAYICSFKNKINENTIFGGR